MLAVFASQAQIRRHGRFEQPARARAGRRSRPLQKREDLWAVLGDRNRVLEVRGDDCRRQSPPSSRRRGRAWSACPRSPSARSPTPCPRGAGDLVRRSRSWAPRDPRASQCRCRGRRTPSRPRSPRRAATPSTAAPMSPRRLPGVAATMAGVEGGLRRVEEAARFGVDVADRDRDRGVAVPTLDDGAAVDRHDVAVVDDPITGDAVHDHLVGRDAGDRGKAVVVEEVGSRPAAVEHVARGAHRGQRWSRPASRRARTPRASRQPPARARRITAICSGVFRRTIALVTRSDGRRRL